MIHTAYPVPGRQHRRPVDKDNRTKREKEYDENVRWVHWIQTRGPATLARCLLTNPDFSEKDILKEQAYMNYMYDKQEGYIDRARKDFHDLDYDHGFKAKIWQGEQFRKIMQQYRNEMEPDAPQCKADVDLFYVEGCAKTGFNVFKNKEQAVISINFNKAKQIIDKIRPYIDEHWDTKFDMPKRPFNLSGGTAAVTVNPLTGRSIHIGGATHKILKRHKLVQNGKSF